MCARGERKKIVAEQLRAATPCTFVVVVVFVLFSGSHSIHTECDVSVAAAAALGLAGERFRGAFPFRPALSFTTLCILHACSSSRSSLVFFAVTWLGAMP